MNAPLCSYRILTGPTAAGKTDWLLRRAQRVPLVVVSADSRQAYRHMDIGTGKVTTAERQKVTHFGLDFLDPSEKISVFSYLRHAADWLESLESYPGEVWVCGGTGLYLRGLLEGLQLGAPPLPELRPALEAVLSERGSAEAAAELGLTVADPRNPRRVLRAIEQACIEPQGMARVSAWLSTLIPKVDISQSKIDIMSSINAIEVNFDTVRARLAGWRCAGLSVLDPGKAELERLIELRVNGMFHGGLLDEVAELTRLGYAEADVVRDGIGYREALGVLAGELALQAAIERSVIRTRQYAKRQRTYFRGMGWLAENSPLPGVA